MNLKYYLRGLGIGILVTTVIMSVTVGGRKETLSDAEIKAKAKELGMIEQEGVLADLEDTEESASGDTEGNSKLPESEHVTGTEQEPDETVETLEKADEQQVSASPSATIVPSPSSEPQVSASPKTTASPVPSSTPEASAKPTMKPEKAEENETEETADAVMDSEVFEIAIKAGDGSYTVCQRLEEAGLIASASAFDTYLYQNGYDKKLRVGTYEIPADAEPETIAKLLTQGN